MILFAILSVGFMMIIGIVGIVLGIRAPMSIGRIFGWLIAIAMFVLIMNALFDNFWLRLR